jgi:hypothetical protein
MRTPAAACCAVAATLLLSVPAGAHEEMALHALTVLDAVEPGVSGLEVRVVHLGGPALVVRNETAGVLTVLDATDRPFLRIESTGVRMNVRSPFAYRSLNPADDVMSPHLGAGSRPRWVEVSGESSWTWFDPRLVYDESGADWVVPMRFGGRDLVARGGFESLHGHGHFRSLLAAPEIAGLEMRLAEGPVPALFVRNETGRVLLVRGRAGEPMLRIGPKGVEANLRSPSYYTSAAQTIARVPRRADVSASPRWKRVSMQPVWAWLEYRAAVDPEMQQRDLLGSDRRTILDWESPMMLAGRPLEVSGTVEWRPPVTPTSSPSGENNLVPWWVASAVMVAAGLMFSSARRKAAVA